MIIIINISVQDLLESPFLNKFHLKKYIAFIIRIKDRTLYTSYPNQELNFINGGLVITKVLIGIPLHNEQAYLSECIKSLYEELNQGYQEYDISVLLVDDGSTDRSQIIYENLAKEYPFSFIRHDRGPLGYGRTILSLFQQSKETFNVLITFDADLQHAPFSIGEILDTLDNHPDVDLVSTSRYLSYRFWKQNTKVPVDRYVTNMIITRMINNCFNLNITDAFCGLKGYRTERLPINIDDAGYSFPLVFWNFIFQNGFIVREIETPIIYRLDRRPRGEWKQRIKNYCIKLESLVSSSELKQLVRKDYQQGVEMLTEILDHYNNFPIYIYHDFFKMNWVNLL